MLTKVEIKNFKSIQNHETLKLNKPITTIIGKNEAGKTSVLKAIEKLNGIAIAENEKNSNSRELDALIKGYFYIEQSKIEKINSEYISNSENTYGIYLLPEKYNGLYFSISVGDESNTKYYSIYYKKDKELVEIGEDFFILRIKKAIENIKMEFVKTLNDVEITMFEEMSLFEDELEFARIYDNYKLKIRNEMKEKIEKLNFEIRKDKWIEYLPNYKFIYFSSFTDVLSDEVLIADINKNVQARNLLKIANIDQEEFKEIVNQNNQSKILGIERISDTKLSARFKDIYNQADEEFNLRIKIDTKDKKVFFLTNDKTSRYEPIPISGRSDGFRWYLSLYLTLYDYIEEKKDKCEYILLIDEPNMYLHASAQQDLLNRVFKDQFSGLQIIYSTHSPYMIDTENLYSIRIVEKGEETRIFNNTQEYVLYTKTPQIDTLTPLSTSIGLNINNGFFDKKMKLLLVEGVQDFYILNAFIKILKKDLEFKNIRIVACIGASKITYMFSYLFGMGYNTFVLVDNDTPGRDVIKKLSKDINDYKLLKYFVNEKKGNCVLEDLFSENDKPVKDTVEYKKIYDNYNDYNFEKKTLRNFENLLKKILQVLNEN